MSNSLLGYLISRIGASPEPAATQALAYILRSSEDVGKAFATLVSQTGVTPVQTGRIAAEERYGDCIPDLTITDTADAVRIFVENKFWAGLTEAQPGAYLNELPAEGVLLFIVPHRRIPSVWGELKASSLWQKSIDRSRPESTEWRRLGGMAMGKKPAARQPSPMWVTTADLPTSAGHPFSNG